MTNISARWVFSDPLEYGRFIRWPVFETVQVSGQQFAAALVRMDLGAVWMQNFWETAPRIARIARIAPDPSRRAIIFRTWEQSNAQGLLRHGGYEVPGDTVLFLGPGAAEMQVIDGAVAFGSMSVASQDLERLGHLLGGGADLAGLHETTPFRPTPDHLFRLRFLHQEAVRMAVVRDRRLNDPQIARAFESHLAYAMVRCMGYGAVSEDGSYIRQRADLIRKFEDYIDAHTNEAIYVAEICQALAVSVRTLERICQEQIGVGPIRYLWLRRLHLARRALVESDASETSVSKIAAAYGFWEFGRFSVRYKTLFGESPSVTLHQARRSLVPLPDPLALGRS
ncbi:MAG: helix-turn-helix domain-containing protein [Xanthobacter sp.]